jgi:FHA domain
MTWFVEHIHRDGHVLSRQAVIGYELRIGRALDNDFVVDDPYCAPYHAKLAIDTTDGTAALLDLDTRNGISPSSGLPKGRYKVENDLPFRLGQTSIRIRSSEWPLKPEQALSLRAVWPFSLAALSIVLLYIAWTIWLRDVNEKSPAYLADIVGAAVGFAVWSGMYALLGRLIGGVDRFFTHLLIATSGYIVLTLVGNGLELLSFSMGWLWPARIATYVSVVMFAFLVRAHLRVADPRHWYVMRWAVALAACLGVVVPLGQLWISSKRLTNIQALGTIQHPLLRIAQPVGIEALEQSALELKIRVDKARTEAQSSDDGGWNDD